MSKDYDQIYVEFGRRNSSLHCNSITQMSFHNDYIYSSSRDGTVKQFKLPDTFDNKLQYFQADSSYDNHYCPINDFCINPRDNLLLSVDRDGYLFSWNLSSHTNSYRSLNSHYEVFNPFETLHPNLTDINLHDTKFIQYRSVIRLHTDTIHAVRYDHAEHCVLTASSDGSMVELKYDEKAKKIHKYIIDMDKHNNRIYSPHSSLLCCSYNNDVIVGGDTHGILHMFDRRSQTYVSNNAIINDGIKKIDAVNDTTFLFLGLDGKLGFYDMRNQQYYPLIVDDMESIMYYELASSGLFLTDKRNSVSRYHIPNNENTILLKDSILNYSCIKYNNYSNILFLGTEEGGIMGIRPELHSQMKESQCQLYINSIPKIKNFEMTPDKRFIDVDYCNNSKKRFDLTYGNMITNSTLDKSIEKDDDILSEDANMLEINTYIKQARNDHAQECSYLNDEKWCDVDICLGFILIKINLLSISKLNSKINFNFEGLSVNLALEFLKGIYAKYLDHKTNTYFDQKSVIDYEKTVNMSFTVDRRIQDAMETYSNFTGKPSIMSPKNDLNWEFMEQSYSTYNTDTYPQLLNYRCTLIDKKNNRKTFMPSNVNISQMDKFIPASLKTELLRTPNSATSQIKSIINRKEIIIERSNKSRDLLYRKWKLSVCPQIKAEMLYDFIFKKLSNKEKKAVKKKKNPKPKESCITMISCLNDKSVNEKLKIEDEYAYLYNEGNREKNYQMASDSKKFLKLTYNNEVLLPWKTLCETKDSPTMCIYYEKA